MRNTTDAAGGGSLTVTFALARPRATPARQPLALAPADLAERAPELLLRSAPWALIGLAAGGGLFALLQARPDLLAVEEQLRALPAGPVLHTVLFFAAVLGFGGSALWRWRADRRERAATEAVLTLDSQGYRLRAPAEDRARSWGMLERVAETQAHLLLLDCLGGAVAVPKAQVAPERVAAIRALAEAAMLSRRVAAP